MATNQGFKSMVPGPKLDASFLYWWLKCHRAQLEQLGNGATFKEVSKAVVERIEIPLPPLEEQKRIAAILDQADDLRRKRQRALDRLNQLGQAIFVEMFGDPTEDRYSSKVTSIGSAQDAGIIVAIQDGNHGEKHPKVSDFVSEGIPFIMANCMLDGELKLENSYKLDPIWRKKLRVGFARPLDVLISHKGTIGQTAVVSEDVDQLILSPQVTYYRPSRSLDSYFLQSYFESLPFQRAIKNNSFQSTRAYIGITRQRELPILIPALEEQIKFRTRVLKIREIRAKALAAASAQLSLFNSLQARAFNGELTASSLKKADP
ncbi:restriction endonuclease subunit S [Azospirillum griseum]|uniref:Restriction endonuclease subunit S n=2 Tax=Azospirillum griseum TaxID=2496639 RepID=A0A431V9Z7_9PROT|nr:restriction endonuclease subunit S [Azospirillum griseum]